MNNTVPTTRDQCKGTAQIDNAPIQNRALRRRPVAGSEEITYGPDDQQPYGSAPTTANIAVPRRKVPQPLDAINFPDAHLRLEVVLALVGMSRSQWYRLIESGHAPKPLRFSSRCSRWVSSSITKFLNDRAIKGASK